MSNSETKHRVMDLEVQSLGQTLYVGRLRWLIHTLLKPRGRLSRSTLSIETGSGGKIVRVVGR